MKEMIKQHTGIFDQCSGMEMTTLDCFVSFITQYEEYCSELKDKGVSSLLNYIVADYIPIAYPIAEHIISDNEATAKIKDMAKKVLSYCDAIWSIRDFIITKTEMEIQSKNRLVAALIIANPDKYNF